MSNDIFTLNLAQKDVQDVLANVKTKVKELTGGKWTNFLDSDLGYALLKAAVAMYDKNAFYTDQMVAETFLVLAKHRESVIRTAKELNYNVGRIQSAQCSVKLTFPAFNEQIDIAADSLWSIDGITFMCEDPITIPSGNTSLELSLIQGTRYTGNFVATGESWFEVDVPLNVADLAVSVEDEGFWIIDSWIDNNIDNAVKVYENVGNKTTLKFGANLGTIRPNDGDQILVEGIISKGAAGNIEENNLPVKPLTIIRDPSNNDITGAFTGVMTSSAIGGQDPESTESIRANAPAFYATQGRLVTAKDYESVIKTIPGVVEVKVIGGETVGMYGSVLIIVHGADPYTVNPDFLDLIYNEVRSKNVVTIKPIVIAPTIVEEIMSIHCGVKSTVFQDSADAVNVINSAVVAHFDALRIGQPRYESALEAAVMAVNGVDFMTFTSKIRTFANSQAGVVKIPLVKNPNLTNCKLYKADNSVLFTGDGTSYIDHTYFKQLSPGLVDQKMTLEYQVTDAIEDGGNIKIADDFLMILKSLEVTTEFTDL